MFRQIINLFNKQRMKDEFYDHLVKVLAVGESGVGKTCII